VEHDTYLALELDNAAFKGYNDFGVLPFINKASFCGFEILFVSERTFIRVWMCCSVWGSNKLSSVVPTIAWYTFVCVRVRVYVHVCVRVCACACVCVCVCAGLAMS
jgi:hypothetical protein